MAKRDTTTIALGRSRYERLEDFKFEARCRSFDQAVEQLLDEAGVEASQGE